METRNWFRDGFTRKRGGGIVAGHLPDVALAPEHQIRRHTDNLLHAIERRDWNGFAAFVSSDYQDQWGNDRARLLERTPEVFRYLRGVRMIPGVVIVQINGRKGTWQAKITIEGDNSEVAALVKERVNSLTTPFTLEWQRVSAKPWDWKLVKVSNPGLEIPAGWQ
jgi:hypothetical protein